MATRGRTTRGRPTKRSTRVEMVIVAALKAGNTRTAAATLAGISYRTLTRWCALSVPFRHTLARAEAEAEKAYVASLKSMARKGNFQAAQFWLKTRRGDQWKEPPAEVHHHHHEVRQEAERLATELGLDVADVLAEAERIVGAGR